MTFPDPGSGADRVPVPGPDDPRSPNTRTYTPRRFDPETKQLEVDFALHGPGPAASWAEQARVGQQVVQMGPAQGYAVDAEAAWYVILGDDAALPAIETILEALPPDTKTTVLLEVVAADEARPLAGPAQTDIRWLVRGPGASPGTALLAGLEGFAWPAGAGSRVRRLRSNRAAAAADHRPRGVGTREGARDRARLLARGRGQPPRSRLR